MTWWMDLKIGSKLALVFFAIIAVQATMLGTQEFAFTNIHHRTVLMDNTLRL